jgi:hypothetical protein
MSLQRRKTEMVGSLLVPTDDMVEATGVTPQSTKGIVNKTSDAVDQFKKDMSTTTKKKKDTVPDSPSTKDSTPQHMEKTLWGETVDEVCTTK